MRYPTFAAGCSAGFGVMAVTFRGAEPAIPTMS
jgi:hypothetical protein